MNLKYTYNGITKTYNASKLATRPIITPSEVSYDRYKIPGRRGEIIGTYGTRSNAKVTFTLHTLSSTIADLTDDITFLRNIGGQLELSNYPDYYFWVVGMSVNSYTSKYDEYARAEITLEIYPFKFLKTKVIPANTVINAGQSSMFRLKTDKAEPIYKFTCVNESSTIAVNGRSFTVYQGADVIIDVMRKIATNEALVYGNYEDIMLDSRDIFEVDGNCQVTAGAGVTLTIVDSREGFVV